MAAGGAVVEQAMALPEQAALVKWLGEFCILSLTIGFGSAAALRGWLPPWLRGHVVSVRLWGVGFLLMGLGLSGEIVAKSQIFVASVASWMAGLLLMLLSQRVGRRRSMRASRAANAVGDDRQATSPSP